MSMQIKNNQGIPKFNFFGELYEDYQSAIPEGIEYSIREYGKNDVIARQGDLCKGLYILIEGSVRTDMIAENGALLHIETIYAVTPLASAFIFATTNGFPVDVTALEKSRILFMAREQILKMFQKDQELLMRYLRYNADKTKFLSDKIQMLSVRTIKAKLAHYILGLHMSAQQTDGDNFTVVLDKNQTELAAFFGVTRPSLARALSEMSRDGLISINKKMVRIRSLKGLMEARG